MLESTSDAPGPGQGRHLAQPDFPDDDGSADPAIRALISEAARGRVPVVSVARMLRPVRLVASVMAVLDERDPAGGDKDSHMAVVSMVNESGDKGLLAFTGVDSLAEWNPGARPVPALGCDIARAALEDGAAALVLDVAGPARLVLEGAALTALADQLDLARAAAVIHAALAPLTADGWAEIEVRDARSTDAGVDVLVGVRVPNGGHPDGRLPADLAKQAAGVIEHRADIHRLVPGGIGVTIR